MGSAVRGEVPHCRQQATRFMVGQNSRGLIEDENFGATDEHLEDFGLLLLSDRQRVDAAAGLDGKS